MQRKGKQDKAGPEALTTYEAEGSGVKQGNSLGRLQSRREWDYRLTKPCIGPGQLRQSRLCLDFLCWMMFLANDF
jgi:hypothetical protein